MARARVCVSRTLTTHGCSWSAIVSNSESATESDLVQARASSQQ